MARSTTCRLHEFDPSLYDWEDWEVLFITFVEVEGISDANKKRNTLITALGIQPFKTLISLCKPQKPTDHTYEEIIQKLRTNYARMTFPSTERIKFFASRQQSSMSLMDFANSLRNEATGCAFPSDFYEQALITAFVGGLHNDQVRKHLMQHKLESFEKTINDARTFESILVQGTKMTKGDEEFSVMRIQKTHKQTPNSHSKATCLSCGSTDHERSKCRFKNVTCHQCKKEGHIAKVCRSRTTSSKHVDTICSVSLDRNDQPIRIRIRLDDHPVDFELDTGSPITIISKDTWIKMERPPLLPVKSTYNSFSGHTVRLKGEKQVKVSYNDTHIPLRVFVTDDHRNNILGRDWIRRLRLDERPLRDLMTNVSVCHIQPEANQLNQMIEQHKAIFKEGVGLCTVKAHLHVKPDCTPRFFKPRSLPFAYRQPVETDLARMVEAGVLEPVDMAKWAAPIVVVPKPGGKLRICADFSVGVNQALDVDQYPLPKPHDLFVALNGGRQFSKLDFSEAYLQVPLDDDSKELLVINTHKGLFRFNRLPFGVASAPSIFQKIMDQMLIGLDGTVCYLDDIIVTGRTTREHLANLKRVFERIEQYGFHINQDKCLFLRDSIEYLGFLVDKQGVRASPTKTQAIVNMPEPNNVSQLRAFLGMVNHYGKFIPKLTDRLHPLYALLKTNTPWSWNKACVNAFKNIKQQLISPLALTHYDPTLPLILAADASNYGVGAVIYHRYPDGSERAIAHTSKTLTPTESRYAQIEKEALALIYGVQKFDQFLRGRKFTLLTDHKPLTTIFGPKKGVPTTAANRLQRWAIRLMGYTFNVEYCSTNQFGQADGLSRLPVGSDITFDQQDPGEVHAIASIQQESLDELPLRASHIAKAMRKDPVLNQVRHYVLSGWPGEQTNELRSYFRIRHELSTSHGCVLWNFRTIIPTCFRRQLLDHLHATHAGMGRMKAEARRYFWWPSLDQDIEELARQCPTCTLNSKQVAKSPLKQWNVPLAPWQRIHIDFMGKFKNLYFLVVVDAHSKWLEVFMMSNTSTAMTITTLTSLFARYGLCEEIVSDNGPQFTSDEFSQFCARNGIRHIRTAPGHPQSNGQAERYVDTVKSALTKGLQHGGRVADVLHKFLFVYRSTVHPTTNSSPAELFLKRELRTVLDLLRPNAADASQSARERYQVNFDRHTKQEFYQSGDKVIVRDFRQDPKKVKWTAGVLIERFGSRLWSVQVEDQTWRRHENQMKHRKWSNDQELSLFQATTPVETSTSDSDHDNAEEETPPTIIGTEPDQGAAPAMLRRSARHRKPVHRLIEDI